MTSLPSTFFFFFLFFRINGNYWKKKTRRQEVGCNILFSLFNVSTFSIFMASGLLENSWSALGLFGGRSPLFSFLVFSISTSLIFSRPNAKGRWPPSFSLPEIVAHVSQKRPRTMDFISIAVSDLLYLVLQQSLLPLLCLRFFSYFPCLWRNPNGFAKHLSFLTVLRTKRKYHGRNA